MNHCKPPIKDPSSAPPLQDSIKRYGGPTAPSAPWPQARSTNAIRWLREVLQAFWLLFSLFSIIYLFFWVWVLMIFLLPFISFFFFLKPKTWLCLFLCDVVFGRLFCYMVLWVQKKGRAWGKGLPSSQVISAISFVCWHLLFWQLRMVCCLEMFRVTFRILDAC